MRLVVQRSSEVAFGETNIEVLQLEGLFKSVVLSGMLLAATI
ncbi:hypothetical protein MNBD_GAMMA12-3806 [hydrothermal vent metagenome]|uniref:Uncharacterized protein n=1 Tax=hydrothermal vent metagenome TaxID=652676 RepID=A0A3B0XVE6_9ZZZZ